MWARRSRGATQVSDNFTAETALLAVVETLRQWGLPDLVGFDRDPRWVGASSGHDFPSAFVRMWPCLGVQVARLPTPSPG